MEPYSEEEGREDGTYLKNGLFAALPDSFGVTLGYTNDPVTFLNRSVPAAATGSRGRKASVTGRIYTLAGKGRPAIHDIVRREYEKRHVRPSFRKTFRQAAEAMLDAFCGLNYDPDTGEYTNRKCRPFKEQELKPWRNVVEIGWTGGAILAYPLVMSRYLLGVPEDSKPMQELSEDGKPMQVLPEEDKTPQALSVEKKLARVLSGEEMLDRIVGVYREESGFLDRKSVV